MRRFITFGAIVCALAGWASPLMACEACGCEPGAAQARQAPDGRAVIVLVGHGAPARDFPKDKLGRFFKLQTVHHSHGEDHGGETEYARDHTHDDDTTAEEYRRLERAVKNWPRTPENDPYKAGVDAIAARLAEKTGMRVMVGFNEFCSPTTGEAIDQALAAGARRVLVTTVMMTPGGGHSERDILRSVRAAGDSNPDVDITYAWPIDIDLIAGVLAEHLGGFDAQDSGAVDARAVSVSATASAGSPGHAHADGPGHTHDQNGSHEH